MYWIFFDEIKKTYKSILRKIKKWSFDHFSVPIKITAI